MIRIFVRRFAWAMVGAAIGLAVVLVVYYCVQAALGRSLASTGGPPVPAVLVGAVSLAATLALGLVPGARDLEVTAARALLRAGDELVVPARQTWRHRFRTAAWIVFHLTSGLVVGFCLFGLVPAAVAVGAEAVAGHSLGTQVPVPDGTGARLAVVIGCVIGGAAMIIAAWPVGVLAERLAPRFLGPTTSDRLQVALDRQRREAEHTLLARELHDGIGHALTIVSVQAAAGQRVAETRPDKAAEALAAIEEVSRGALAELDALLGILRDDRAPSPAGGVADVVDQHRRTGLTVRDDIDLPADLPPLLRRTVVRIVTEGLTNARRHGAPGEVRLAVGHVGAEVTIRVSNAVAALSERRDDGAAQAGGFGRGLAGIRERAALFGGAARAGVVDQGADAGRWLLDVSLPGVTAARRHDAGVDRTAGEGRTAGWTATGQTVETSLSAENARPGEEDQRHG